LEKHIAVHKLCTGNKELIESSMRCGCFYCLKIFNPKRIKVEDWIDELHGKKTAMCPYCGIDSVIGDGTGERITKRLLKKMNKYWF